MNRIRSPDQLAALDQPALADLAKDILVLSKPEVPRTLAPPLKQQQVRADDRRRPLDDDGRVHGGVLAEEAWFRRKLTGKHLGKDPVAAACLAKYPVFTEQFTPLDKSALVKMTTKLGEGAANFLFGIHWGLRGLSDSAVTNHTSPRRDRGAKEVSEMTRSCDDTIR